jgi:hypothetical protein
MSDYHGPARIQQAGEVADVYLNASAWQTRDQWEWRGNFISRPGEPELRPTAATLLVPQEAPAAILVTSIELADEHRVIYDGQFEGQGEPPAALKRQRRWAFRRRH